MTATVGALIQLFHRTLVHLYFGTRWGVGSGAPLCGRGFALLVCNAQDVDASCQYAINDGVLGAGNRQQATAFRPRCAYQVKVGKQLRAICDPGIDKVSITAA
jgi:hypothetical protein